MEKPLLSVCLITYNHVSFIRNAIEGVLSQKVNFLYEFIIADDFSIDGTRAILIEYQKQYPKLIRLILQEKNVGAAENWFDLIKSPKAKYIAYFEGDDYWIDEFKLQKQVDFLQANQQYILCFTRGFINNKFSNTSVLNSPISCGQELNIHDFIKANNQLTATVLFINSPDFSMPGWFKMLAFGDWALYLLLMHQYSKKAFCLPDATAVYRIHSTGNHGKFHESKTKLINAYKMHIAFYRVIGEKLLGNAYKKIIKASISEKSAIITKLYCEENLFMKGLETNIIYLLTDISWKTFFQNVFYLQKHIIKSIVYKNNSAL